MESYTKPEVKETLANNGKIYESSGNISVSSKKYTNSNETENVDLSIVEGSNVETSSIVSSNNESIDSNYNSPEYNNVVNSITSIISEGVGEANRSLVNGFVRQGFVEGFNDGVLIVYDSFHGKENEPASDFIDDFLFERFSKYFSKKIESRFGEIKKDAKDYFREKMKLNDNEKLPLEKSIEEKIKTKIAEKIGEDKFNKDYKLGQNWKYDAIDLYKKDLWDFSDDIWGKGKDFEGKWGSASLYASVGSFDTHGSFRFGPDHIVLDASAAVDVFKIEGAYETPALKTKDGLELYSVGFGGEVSVLHAEAKARAGAGLFKDEDGKKHLEAGVQLKAEADLVKATVSNQTTLLGVTAKGSFGVKIGIGAQVDIGFVDGELNFNVSAAVGLGFEIGVSLDFSKLTNYFENTVPRQRDASTMVGSGIW